MKKFLPLLMLTPAMAFGPGCGTEALPSESTEPLAPTTTEARLGTGFLAAPQSALAGTVVGSDGSRLYYLGSENHVHEMKFTGSWVHTDLNSVVPADPVYGPARDAAPNSRLAAFVVKDSSGQSVPRVYYVGGNNRVYELWLGQRWYYRDLLSSASGAPLAAPGAALAGTVVGNGGSRVYYLAADNHVHELKWDEQSMTWSHTDLNAIVQADPVQGPVRNAAPNSPLLATVVKEPGGQMYPRVAYVGNDGHIYQLWLGQRWNYRDLTASAPGAALAAPGTAMAGAAMPNGDSGLYYMAADKHIHELKWNNASATWSHTDLNSIIPADPVYGPVRDASASSGLTATSVQDATGQTNPRVYYVGSDSRVYELWLGQRWYYRNLFASAPGAGAAAASSAMASFTLNGNLSRAYYEGTNNHLYEMQWNGQSWSSVDLSTTAN
ncbi:hypothetical protein [Hyalangium gracile]|uniref:hypothetical protein n=1 Tax=Hyalangium gracile TaxID=394092 RepID=UPI001CCCC1C5|nr:hypothetical protein [Hyalangium gracile]